MRRVLCLGLVLCAVAATAGPASAAKAVRLELHSTVFFTGQTLGSGSALHTTGRVVATARWKGGAVYVLARRRTDAAGNWKVRFHPSYLGRYTVHILTPDGGTLDYTFIVY